MSKTYFRHTDGSTLIPIADGDVVVTNIQTERGTHQVHVAFYDADGETLITPSTGTLTFRAGYIEGQYLDASANATINAVEVEAGDASYTPAQFSGPISHAKMTKASLAGATYVAAYVWSDD